MCETPPRRSPLRVTPPKAPVKKNRYVPRTRVFSFDIDEGDNFKSYLHCEEELPSLFTLPPLPKIKPFTYKLEFLTGRVMSKFRRCFPFYINDLTFFRALLDVINDEVGSNLNRNHRATMVMHLLTCLASTTTDDWRKQAIDLIHSHTLFWKMHQTLGMEFLKSVEVKIVFPNPEEVVETVTIPLFDEDIIIEKNTNKVK